MLTFGSLFAGIGGFDLGFERARMTCKWQVEIDEFCLKVLAKHWPDVRRYKDVKEVHGIMAHAKRERPQGQGQHEQSVNTAQGETWKANKSFDGSWWSVEPDVGRVAHGVPARVDRLKSLGNAVVPQVAEWIGRQIVKVESGTRS